MIEYVVERNPCINFLNEKEEIIAKILCIGDPHLGKVFKTGVPSHRLGDREEHQFSTFKNLLNSKNTLVKNIIIMGDIFDKFVVSPTTVLRVYELIKEAVLSNPDISYSLIPGNHDLSKDRTKKSSYELLYVSLQNLEESTDNLTVVLHNNSYDIVEVGEERYYLNLIAYSPFDNSNMWDKELEKDVFLTDPLNKGVISFGHWDSLDILDSGYTPTQELLDKSILTVSGHEHTYREYIYPFDKNKNKVLFTGSMQPYSHAEDLDKDIYITLTPEELDNYDLEKDLQYSCVRIECDPFFILQDNIECYSLIFKTINKEIDVLEEDVESLTVENYNDTLYNSLNEKEDLPEHIKQELLELLKNKSYLS